MEKNVNIDQSSRDSHLTEAWAWDNDRMTRSSYCSLEITSQSAQFSGPDVLKFKLTLFHNDFTFRIHCLQSITYYSHVHVVV